MVETYLYALGGFMTVVLTVTALKPGLNSSIQTLTDVVRKEAEAYCVRLKAEKQPRLVRLILAAAKLGWVRIVVSVSNITGISLVLIFVLTLAPKDWLDFIGATAFLQNLVPSLFLGHAIVWGQVLSAGGARYWAALKKLAGRGGGGGAD